MVEFSSYTSGKMPVSESRREPHTIIALSHLWCGRCLLGIRVMRCTSMKQQSSRLPNMKA